MLVSTPSKYEGPSWEIYSRSINQTWNPQMYCRVYNRPPLDEFSAKLKRITASYHNCFRLIWEAQSLLGLSLKSHLNDPVRISQTLLRLSWIQVYVWGNTLIFSKHEVYISKFTPSKNRHITLKGTIRYVNVRNE